MTRWYHMLGALALTFCAALGCSDGHDCGSITITTNGADGGEDSPAPFCTRHFDVKSGAEISDGCPQPDDSECAAAYCDDGHLCHIHHYPIGSACGSGGKCDGAGMCAFDPVQCPPCDDNNPCTDDFCATDTGTCFHVLRSQATTCGTVGHCDPDHQGSCCEGVFAPDLDGGAADFYMCQVACPMGQKPNPATAICG